MLAAEDISPPPPPPHPEEASSSTNIPRPVRPVGYLGRVSVSNYIRAFRGALINLIPFPWRANPPNVVLLAVNYDLSNPNSIKEFKLDFGSRILFTYREHFFPILGESFTKPRRNSSGDHDGLESIDDVPSAAAAAGLLPAAEGVNRTTYQMRNAFSRRRTTSDPSSIIMVNQMDQTSSPTKEESNRGTGCLSKCTDTDDFKHHTGGNDHSLLLHFNKSQVTDTELDKSTSTPSSRSLPYHQILSDSGWGCMLRVSQMALAQCLLYHVVGRLWRRRRRRLVVLSDVPQSSQGDDDLGSGHHQDKNDIYSQGKDINRRVHSLEDMNRQTDSPTTAKDDHEAQIVAVKGIISLFMDRPMSPFSLHNLVYEGWRRFGKAASEWFGPTSAATTISTLMEAWPEACYGLKPVVFPSGDIYTSLVTRHFAEPSNTSSGILIWLCLRLGVERFNEEKYQNALQSCFSVPQFQGLAGGGPSSSAYFFVAANKDSLFYLDPHMKCQNAFSSYSELDSGGLAEFFSDEPRQLAWRYLNPSMALTFVCRSQEEYEDLCLRLKTVDSNLFEIYDEVPKYDYSTDAMTLDEEDPDLVLL